MRRLRRTLVLGLLAVVLAVGGANAYVLLDAGAAGPSAPAQVPHAQAALVLGSGRAGGGAQPADAAPELTQTSGSW